MILKINKSTKYRRSEKVAFKQTGSVTVIILPNSGVSVEEPAMITLSDTGGFIWGLLDGTIAVEQVIDQVVEVYDVSEDQAEGDVIVFLQKLATREMIIE